MSEAMNPSESTPSADADRIQSLEFRLTCIEQLAIEAFGAIREAFRHQADFLGRGFDATSEIASHLHDLKEEVRQSRDALSRSHGE